MNYTLTMLGTGGAFAPRHQGNSNAFLRVKEGEHLDKVMLIDAGSHIQHDLADFNLSVPDIDAVYVTHVHADHTGGLEYLAFARTFLHPGTPKIKLFANPEVMKDIETLLSVGTRKTLSDWFDVKPVLLCAFEWCGIEFQTRSELHIADVNLYSHGLFTDRFAFSGDCNTLHRLFPEWLEKSPHAVMLHDVFTGDACDAHTPLAQYIEFANLYRDKTYLPSRHNTPRFWGYHYNDNLMASAAHNSGVRLTWRGCRFNFRPTGTFIDTATHS